MEEVFEVELLSLEMENFKGLKKRKFEFGRLTNIHGDNATFKTTIADAYKWLLFNKDSTDRTQFEIKTLDKNNEPIHGLDHAVTGVLRVCGKIKTLKKIYREIWQKKRGETDRVCTGHETAHYIDDVPVLAGEYKKEINDIIDEGLLKQFTDPLYFSQVLPWEKRRKILIEMVEKATIDEIIKKSGKIGDIKSLLTDTTIEDLKKRIKETITELNKDIIKLPIRIDECNNSIVEINITALTNELKERSLELVEIEESLTDLTVEDPKLLKKRDKLTAIREERRKIKENAEEANAELINSRKVEVSQLGTEKNDKLDDIENSKAVLEKLEKEKAEDEEKLNASRKGWYEINNVQFKIDDDLICPLTNGTCEDVNTIKVNKNTLLENFNELKAKNLNLNVETGKLLKASIELIEDSIKIQQNIPIQLKEELDELDAKLKLEEESLHKLLNEEFKYPAEYQALTIEILGLTKDLENSPDAAEQTQSLRESKSALTDKIDGLKGKLTASDNNVKLRIRIEALGEEEKQLAQQIADLEKQEFMCDEYIKTEANLLDSKINSKFSLVKFKLFDIQVNGALNPTCETLINGVPFSDANGGGQINGGFDIINSLSEHYKFSAPRFVDNAESVTELIPSNSQTIRLIVVKQLKGKQQLMVDNGTDPLFDLKLAATMRKLTKEEMTLLKKEGITEKVKDNLFNN